MTPEIWVGVLSLMGTAVGTVAGILTSSKMTNYRIEQLEKKVEKHNGMVDRMYKVEGRIDVLATEIEEMRANR